MNTGISDCAFSTCTWKGRPDVNDGAAWASTIMRDPLSMSRHLARQCGLAFAQGPRFGIVRTDYAIQNPVRDAMHDALFERVPARLVRSRRHTPLHDRVDAEVLEHDLRILLVVPGTDDVPEVGALHRRLRKRPVLVETQLLRTLRQVLAELHVRRREDDLHARLHPHMEKTGGPLRVEPGDFRQPRVGDDAALAEHGLP